MALTVCLIGGGKVGRALAARLAERGNDVTVVESDPDVAAALEADGYDVVRGDGTDLSVLDAAGVDEADVAVAATADDDSNLLTTQLLRRRFDTERVVARVNRPTNAEAFEDLGITTVAVSDATARAIDDQIACPTFTRWVDRVGRGGDVQEVAVTAPEYAGRTVGELDAAFPEQCLIVTADESGTAHLPDDEETVEAGEHLTVLGEREAVATAVEALDPSE